MVNVVGSSITIGLQNDELPLVSIVFLTFQKLFIQNCCVVFQAQYNVFVFNLRDQYSKKVYTFRQVIEVHRIELQQKEQYWDEALAVSTHIFQTDYCTSMPLRLWFFDIIGRVPTDLESQGKPDKIKWSLKVRELFFISPKGQGTFF